MMRRRTSFANSSAFLTVVFLLALPVVLAGYAQAPIQLVKISSDIFTNTDMQHATEVEPDTYSFGSTIVSAFQVGRRYANGGSSDIGFAISTDSGTTWKHGFLPGLTTHYKGGKFPAVSDPSVSYDSKHGVWIVASLGISDVNGNTVLLSSSSPDGVKWNNPVTADNTSAYGDKDWLVCDNGSSSPFLGNCYIEWDDAGSGGNVRMVTSTDGGKSWSKPFNVPNAFGLGGQPVVRPDGTAVVPFSGAGIQAFTSTNGGKTWNSPVTVDANVNDHFVNGGLRTSVLPSAEVDGGGTVYVVWQDCTFRSGCSSNDVVMSKSTNGKTWSKVSRIPIDPVTSTVDHFIPSIAADTSTSGNTAHLGVTYYYYPVSNCNDQACNLSVGFVSSKDGGATWTQGKKLAGGMKTGWLPNTTLGYMVGDYISTSYVNGKGFGVFAKALKPTGSTFHESMYTPAIGMIAEEEGPYFSSAGERPVPGAKSDHGPRKFYDQEGLIPIPPSKQAPASR